MPMRLIRRRSRRLRGREQAVLGDGLVELGDLVALGVVGVEVVLAGEDAGLADLAVDGFGGEHGELDRLALSTGSAPGRPRQVGQVWVLGSPPYSLRSRRRPWTAVRSWTWTSSPMTGWYLARISGEMRGYGWHSGYFSNVAEGPSRAAGF